MESERAVLQGGDTVSFATEENFASEWALRHGHPSDICIVFAEGTEGFVPPCVVNSAEANARPCVRFPRAVLASVWPPSSSAFVPEMAPVVRRILRALHDRDGLIVLRVDASVDIEEFPSEFRLPRVPDSGSPRIVDPETMIEYGDCIDVMSDAVYCASRRLVSGCVDVKVEVSFSGDDSDAAGLYESLLLRKHQAMSESSTP